MRMGKRQLWASLIAAIGLAGCSPTPHDPLESTQVTRQALDGTSAWSITKDMNAARTEHAALLLSDKRVLVVGGANDPANAAAYYQITEDPETKAQIADWIPIAAPTSFSISSQPGCRPALAQIDDTTVLVVSTDWNDKTSKVSTLDLMTSTWTSRYDLPNPTCSPHAITLENKNVLILVDDTSNKQLLPFIYDSTNQTVSTTTALPTPKAGNWVDAAVIRLADNSVLVSGGGLDANNLAQNSESLIFDPSDPAGPWISTGEMTTARAQHAVALLPNKNVLAIGGFTQSPAQNDLAATAEVFDVDLRAWTSVAPMSTAREHGHTATTLESGLVLVVGGSISSTAELFDLSSNAWTLVERSDDRRYYGHSSTLLDDGQVLVAGGTQGSDAALCNALVFTWQPQESIVATTRAFHSSTFLDEKTLLIVGGAEESGNGDLTSLQDSWLYNVNDGTSVAGPVPNFPRAFHTATKLDDGKIFVVGGSDTSALASEILEPSGSSYTWKTAASLSRPIMRAVATFLDDGTVFHVGGIYSDKTNEVANDVLLYKPDSDAWESPSLPNLPDNPNRFGHTLTKLKDGSVLAIGGFTACPTNAESTSAIASVARYYPATKTWTSVESMNQIRGFHSATLLENGQVLVAGGGASISGNCMRPTWDGVHTSAEVYDSDNDTWTTVGIMGEARADHQAILLSSKKVLIAGGRRANDGRTLATAELYDPDTKTWTTTSRLQKGRYGHTLNSGPNGVLAVGGFRKFPPSNGEVDIELYSQAAQGIVCSLDEQCASGFCSSGVCCDEACNDSCHSCSKIDAISRGKEQYKTKDDGFCEDISGCTDFACVPETGLCKTECSDVKDCVPGYVCNPQYQCIKALPNASTLDQSGCRAASSESNNPPWGSILLVAGALVARRSRRPLRVQGN